MDMAGVAIGMRAVTIMLVWAVLCVVVAFLMFWFISFWSDE